MNLSVGARFSRMATPGHKLRILPLLLSLGLAAGCQWEDPVEKSESDLNAGATLSVPLIPIQACADPLDQTRLANDMIDAINSEREKRGIGPLRQSATLMQIADFYACRLVDGRFFDHYDPFDGATADDRATDFGYAFYQIGENLAARQQSVNDAMTALMNSPRHKANILDPIYTEVGIAVKTGGEHGIYWVQEFGRPISDELPTGFDLTTTQPAATPKAPRASQSQATTATPTTSTSR